VHFLVISLSSLLYSSVQDTASAPIIHLMLFVMYFTVISYHLHSSDHGSDGEEAQYFCENNTNRDELLAVDVPDATEHALGVCAFDCRTGAGHHSPGVSCDVDYRLEVGLELRERGWCHLLPLKDDL